MIVSTIPLKTQHVDVLAADIEQGFKCHADTGRISQSSRPRTTADLTS